MGLMRRYLLLILVFLAGVAGGVSAAAPSATVLLRGHLDSDKLAEAHKTIAALRGQGAATVVIEVRSTSGDLYGVLDVAKTLYELKEADGAHVIVYIDDEAVGPAAVLPFLADELYISLFVSWGDVPAGSDVAMPTNLLRSRVVSLIAPASTKASLLTVLADGMVDPAVKIIVDNGWRVATPDSPPLRPVISPEGETLVVNQNQLRELGVVDAVLSLQAFRQRFAGEGEKEKAPVVESDQGSRAPLAVDAATLEKLLAAHITFAPGADNTVGYLAIDDKKQGISESTWIYVKSALDYYREHKPRFIILKLNTPGGQVFASQKISDALRDIDSEAGIPVVAFIDNWAISAGAMLAYSCRFIAVVKDAAMGAAEPVLQGASGQLETASEKVNSALRTDFGNRAEFYNRDPLIAQAMVDKDMLLVLRYGKVVKLESDAEIRKGGPDADKVISAKGKLLTLSGAELIDYGVADIMVPRVTLAAVTSEELWQGRWSTGKEPLFQNSFFKALPAATIDAYRMDWKGQFFAFLSSPVVASLLVLGVMIGFYVEISTPGFGIPGSIAVICVLLMILSSFALEAVGWLEMILILMGSALVAVDIFFIPTFGFLGIVGIVFVLAGVFGLLLPGLGSISYDFDSQTLNAAGDVVIERLAWLCGALIVGVIIIAVLGRYVAPRLTMLNPFVLKGEQESSQGFVAGPTPQELPVVGNIGQAATTLRPAGKVIIDGTLYDAVSSGTFIEKDSAIIVTAIDGYRIVVDVDAWKEKGQ